jgi:hypothetical protein
MNATKDVNEEPLGRCLKLHRRDRRKRAAWNGIGRCDPSTCVYIQLVTQHKCLQQKKKRKPPWVPLPLASPASILNFMMNLTFYESQKTHSEREINENFFLLAFLPEAKRQKLSPSSRFLFSNDSREGGGGEKKKNRLRVASARASRQ